MLVTGTISAQTFNDGTFNYNVIDVTNNYCEVTGWSVFPSAPVDVVIPGTVMNLGITYTVKQIGNGAFSAHATSGTGRNPANTNVRTVTLPPSVTTLSAHSFRTNPNLTSINLDHIVDSGSNTFANCTGLTGEMNLPACTTFGDYTFVFCTNITKVNIPIATIIGEGALRETGITSMNIPASVSSIKGQLFRGCAALTEVTVKWANPASVTFTTGTYTTTTWQAITPTNVKIYVPAGTKSTYETTQPWLQVGAANIIESAPLSTHNVEKELGAVVYPNPTTGNVTLKMDSANAVDVIVYDLNGKALLTKKVNDAQSEINLSGLNTGIYLFNVKTENGEFTKRIVKQ
ncbi:T9SS C-terminal target domain-containing protein [Flavobacterium sp. UMI-01]|nr:T9SS C-terminal target domain-containing protein [Flavobacterium sp. UMI-01]